MIQTMHLFKKNQDDLFELLKKKDLEIAELVGGNDTNSILFLNYYI